MGLFTKRIAGKRASQFRHSPDVSRTKLRDFYGCLALHNGKMGKLFRAITGEVMHGGIGLECPGEDFKERDMSGERIGDSLEYIERERFVVRYFHRLFRARSITGSRGLSSLGWHCGALCRSGGIGYQEVQQVVSSDV